jgi:hypothetical protein
MVDGAGLRIWDITPGNVKEVLRRYPRGDTLRAARSLRIAAGRADGSVRLLSYAVANRARRSSRVEWKCPAALS